MLYIAMFKSVDVTSRLSDDDVERAFINDDDVYTKVARLFADAHARAVHVDGDLDD